MSSRWVSKPPVGSQIGWGHPLSKGLVGCWLMNEGGGRPRELLCNALFSAISGTPILSQGRLLLSSLNDYIDYTDRAGKFNSLLGSITLVAKVFTSTSTTDEIIISKVENNGPTLTPFSFGIYRQGATSYYPLLARASASAYKVWAGTQRNMYLKTSFVAISQKNTIDTTPIMFVDGGFDTPSAVYGGSGTGLAAGNSKPVTIGNRDDDSTQFYGSIYFIYIYNRALSPSEIQSLYESPYQFIKGPSTITYFTPPAVGGWVWGGEVKNVMVA